MPAEVVRIAEIVPAGCAMRRWLAVNNLSDSRIVSGEGWMPAEVVRIAEVAPAGYAMRRNLGPEYPSRSTVPVNISTGRTQYE